MSEVAAVAGSSKHHTPTREERAAAGKAARDAVPLAAHADLFPAPDQDPVGLLQSQAASRLEQLVPVRYGRMLVSPFTFYRGAALVMADDLSRGPRSGLDAQLCGDAHLSNFGVFASPERQLVFDLNDFDESHPGPFEWDVKRLAASIEVAGRDNGYSAKQRRAAVLAAVATYRTSIREFAGMTNLQVWHAQSMKEGTPGLREVDKRSRKSLRASVDKARTRDGGHALRKLTEVVDGHRRIVNDAPLLIPIRDLPVDPFFASLGVEVPTIVGWMDDLVEGYRATLRSDSRQLLNRYTFVDMAHKVVGVGSVGLRAWVVLMRGIDESDALLLQAKQAVPSVLEAYTQPSAFDNNGQRVVTGQRLMQAFSDITLGWLQVQRVWGSGDYYFRQLKDWKGSAEIEQLRPEGMTAYTRLCGWTLARAHARTGDRVAIGAYLGSKDTFDNALAEFASAYADKTERDHALLQQATSSGRVPVWRGV